MGYEQIIWEKDAEKKILRITLNRPEKRNAMGIPMLDEIITALDEAAWDDEVKVVVIKGAGPCLTSGHDLDEVVKFYPQGKRRSQRDRVNRDRRWRAEKWWRIYSFNKPIIVQVHGYAMAAGVVLCMIADIVVAADDAQFSFAPLRFGGPIEEYILPLEIQTLGLRNAKYAMYTGAAIDAKEAKEMNMITKAVPPDKLEEEVNKIAQAVALLPLDGLVLSKEWINMTLGMMGVMPGFIPGYLGHSLWSNIHYEPDEYNFLKSVREKGMREAFRVRDGRFEGLVKGLDIPNKASEKEAGT
ncbi:MAG: enoyl-CoA hydratase/isomerase family protein [Candidatus Tectomicrobia bacterium]|nr:enoyl-CoA hydratase/isomerase family protein [Candidatus Tectomicrobia bacterium]